MTVYIAKQTNHLCKVIITKAIYEYYLENKRRLIEVKLEHCIASSSALCSCNRTDLLIIIWRNWSWNHLWMVHFWWNHMLFRAKAYGIVKEYHAGWRITKKEGFYSVKETVARLFIFSVQQRELVHRFTWPKCYSTKRWKIPQWRCVSYRGWKVTIRGYCIRLKSNIIEINCIASLINTSSR